MNNELDLELTQAFKKYTTTLSAYGYNNFDFGRIAYDMRIILCHISESCLKNKKIDIENSSGYINSVLIWVANRLELHEQLIITSGKSSAELDSAFLSYIVALSAFEMGFQAYDLLPNWKESCYNIWSSYFNEEKIKNKDEDTGYLFLSLWRCWMIIQSIIWQILKRITSYLKGNFYVLLM